MKLQPIVDAILEDYALPILEDHGVSHWARELNEIPGLHMSSDNIGWDVKVVGAFSVHSHAIDQSVFVGETLIKEFVLQITHGGSAKRGIVKSWCQ